MGEINNLIAVILLLNLCHDSAFWWRFQTQQYFMPLQIPCFYE